MNRRRFILSLAGFLLTFFFSRRIAWANKAEAKIEVPGNVTRGSEITVRVTVIHSANNFFHHVEWLWIKVNDEEVAHWNYSATDRPEGATFTKEIKYKVGDNVEIKAKASCNIHGSAGEAVAKVMPSEK